jgi:hypothetical protein
VKFSGNARRLLQGVDARLLAARAERDLAVLGDGAEAGVVVGEDDPVVAAVVQEEEADAEVLGEARHEGEVGLLVLDDDLALGVRVGEAHLDLGPAEGDELQLLRDDRGHAAAEEDVLRLDQREPLHARDEHDTVRAVPGLGREHVRGLGDHPVDRSRLLAPHLEDQGSLRAGEIAEREGGALQRDEIDLEAVELRDGLPAEDALDLESARVEVVRFEAGFGVG